MSRRPLITDLVRNLAAAVALPHRFRPALLRLAGVEIGPRTRLQSGAQFIGPGTVSIGTDAFVNANCYFDAQSDITIGDRASIGDHVRFVTSTHEDGTAAKRAGALKGLPISVGAGSWLGSGVTVLPGVSIGTGCVVAAGSMVTRDCEPDGMYAGVPAQRKRVLA